MISIVYSTRKDNPKFKEHIEKTCGHKKIEVIQITNDGEMSLTQAYNKGLDEANNDLIVFCHDDIILKEGWGKKLTNHFKNSDYGILGMAGTTDLDESGQWWKDNTKMVGIVKHTSDGKTWESKYSNNFGSDIIETVMLDGLFFAINKNRIKKRFNEDIEGFHFYDFDFTFGNHLEGVKVGVIFDIKITHKSVGQTNEQWEKNRLQFCELYTNNLPYKLPVEIKYDGKLTKSIKNPPKVSVIIPTKGNVDMLKNCVNSILEVDRYPNLNVYIADTGSTEEEKDRIKNELLLDRTNVHFINYDYYNFASINNDVVKNHIDNETELLLFCNNDIKLVNDAITRMVNVYVKNKKQVGTIGARLHFGDNTIQHSGITVFLNQQQNGFYFPSLTHHGLKSYHTYHQGQKEVLGNTAAFMMVNKDLFNNIGGFNEEYNECFEDVHLNIDCLRFNRKNIFVGDAVCYHYESQTRNKDGEKQKRESEDYIKRIIPYIINNKKTYKYFTNVSETILTQILNKQSNEIRSIV